MNKNEIRKLSNEQLIMLVLHRLFSIKTASTGCRHNQRLIEVLEERIGGNP